MIHNFENHNFFKKSQNLFNKTDPHLQNLKEQQLQFSDLWWKNLSKQSPGIYLISGGRQTGKSTSFKLFIKQLIKDYPVENISYLACDLIHDRFELIDNIRFQLQKKNREHPFWLFLDEITFISEWDISIKALADEGLFRNNFCFITGSDNILLQQARRGLVGRRGNAEIVDFFIKPLSYKDYYGLIKNKQKSRTREHLFQDFLCCGGYLKAVNDYYAYGRIQTATLRTYADWLTGDFEKYNKSVRTLVEVLKAIKTCYTSQVTYGSLLDHVQEISKPTLINYLEYLERMEVIITLHAYDQNKKGPALRKAKKIYFKDPFLLSVTDYLLKKHYQTSGKVTPESHSVEGIVISEFSRAFPCYYFKGKGEIDLISVVNQIPQYYEVKWQQQPRPNDLKELGKFPDSKILSKDQGGNIIAGIKSYSLIEELLTIDQSGKQLI